MSIFMDFFGGRKLFVAARDSIAHEQRKEQLGNDRDIVEICRSIGFAFDIKGASALTTFKGGGSACVFAPSCEDEFIGIYSAFSGLGIKPFILGGGSDVIISDGLCSVPVIFTKNLNNVRICDNRVYAECGARISDVIAKARMHGLGGLEFLVGVPATVGGAAHMNAGAFGAQTADYIKELRILSVGYEDEKPNCADARQNGGADFHKDERAVNCRIKCVSKNDINFGYRQGAEETVLGVTFELERLDAIISAAKADGYLKYRAARQPKYPSCGSVFKNGDIPSGRLIEECGLKGRRVGGAMISELHGNFIVNTGGATADDFMALVQLCEREVLDKFGINMEREFIILHGL